MIHKQQISFWVLFISLMLVPNTGFTEEDGRPEVFKNAEFLIHYDVDSAANLIEHLNLTTDARDNTDLKLGLEYLNVNLLFAQGSFAESIQRGDQLLIDCENLVDKRLELRVLLLLAKCSQYTGLKPRQIELNQRAYDIAYTLHDTSAVVATLNSTGDAFRSSESETKCISYYRRAYKIAQYTRNELELAECEKFIGSYHLWKTKNDSSLTYLQKSLLHIQNSNYLDEISLIWIRLCRSYIMQDELQLAEQCIRKSISIAEQLHSKLWLGRAYFQLGRIQGRRKDYNLALQSLDSAQTNLIEAEDLIVLNNVHMKKAAIYNKLNLVDSSFRHYRTHIRYKDSIDKRENYALIIDMEWNQELERKEKSISFLREKSEIMNLKEAADQRARIWLFVVLGVVMLLAIFLYQLFKQRNKSLRQERKFRVLDKKQSEQEIRHQEQIGEMATKQHQLELEIKNKELTSLTMEISQKSQNITDIHQKIKGIQETIKPDSALELNTLKELRGISRQLKTDSGKEKEWQQFKLHFEQVHTSFFDNLKNKHPELTSYDLKLCAYFHMNLGIKQVANIMSVSYDAIKKQRTRMRKKMELASEMSLLNYLNSVS